jgi:hypothetical protein
VDEKRFRFDLMVALGALLISGVAAASSAYQTYVTRDGKIIALPATPTTMPALADAIGPERAEAKADAAKFGAHGPSQLTASTILSGDVLPAGGKLELLRVEGKFLTRRVLADIRRVDLTLCYCSLLGDCWTKRLWDPAVRPRPVRACPSA